MRSNTGTIMKEIEIEGENGRKRAMSLFDSGASCSLIRRDVAEEVSTILKIPTPFEFVLGDGETTLTAEYVTFVEFALKGYRYPPQRVIVVDKLEDDLIFGVDTLQVWKIKLDFVNEDVVIDKSVLRLRLFEVINDCGGSIDAHYFWIQEPQSIVMDERPTRVRHALKGARVPPRRETE